MIGAYTAAVWNIQIYLSKTTEEFFNTIYMLSTLFINSIAMRFIEG